MFIDERQLILNEIDKVSQDIAKCLAKYYSAYEALNGIIKQDSSNTERLVEKCVAYMCAATAVNLWVKTIASRVIQAQEKQVEGLLGQDLTFSVYTELKNISSKVGELNPDPDTVSLFNSLAKHQIGLAKYFTSKEDELNSLFKKIYPWITKDDAQFCNGSFFANCTSDAQAAMNSCAGFLLAIGEESNKPAAKKEPTIAEFKKIWVTFAIQASPLYEKEQTLLSICDSWWQESHRGMLRRRGVETQAIDRAIRSIEKAIQSRTLDEEKLGKLRAALTAYCSEKKERYEANRIAKNPTGYKSRM